MWLQCRRSGNVTKVYVEKICHTDVAHTHTPLFQVKLFHSIKPLFANKPIVLVINKIDQVKPEDLPEEQRAWIEEIARTDNATVLTMSCYSEEGVMNVRNTACDKLLAARVEMKMSGNKINDVINKIHLAIPAARDNIARLPNIPEGALNRMKYDPNDPNRPKLEKDLEIEAGGAGVYNYDMKSKYHVPIEANLNVW